MDRGAPWATVYGVAESDMTKRSDVGEAWTHTGLSLGSAESSLFPGF